MYIVQCLLIFVYLVHSADEIFRRGNYKTHHPQKGGKVFSKGWYSFQEHNLINPPPPPFHVQKIRRILRGPRKNGVMSSSSSDTKNRILPMCSSMKTICFICFCRPDSMTTYPIIDGMVHIKNILLSGRNYVHVEGLLTEQVVPGCFTPHLTTY